MQFINTASSSKKPEDAMAKVWAGMQEWEKSSDRYDWYECWWSDFWTLFEYGY